MKRKQKRKRKKKTKMSIHSILLVRRFSGKTGSNAKLKEKRKKEERRGENEKLGFTEWQ